MQKYCIDSKSAFAVDVFGKFSTFTSGFAFVFYSVFSMYCLEKLEKYLAVFTGNYTYAGMLFGLLSVDKKLI